MLRKLVGTRPRQRRKAAHLTLRHHAAAEPEATEHGDQSQPSLGAVLRVITPLMRRQQIVTINIQSREPRTLLRPFKRLSSPLCQIKAERKMAFTYRNLFAGFA